VLGDKHSSRATPPRPSGHTFAATRPRVILQPLYVALTWSSFSYARGAPPPLARAAPLEDSLCSRGPQALLSRPSRPTIPAHTASSNGYPTYTYPIISADAQKSSLMERQSSQTGLASAKRPRRKRVHT